MKFQRQIDQCNVTVICENDLQEQAEGLLAKLADLNKRNPLKDGTTIQFGWSRLKLHRCNNELIVHEPDFYGDPFHHDVPGVEQTLRVIVEQVALLNHAGIDGTDISFEDKIVISKGCLQMEQNYLKRSPAETVNDSGWYIGATNDSGQDTESENLEVIYVYELLTKRRSLMSVLTLPTGYFVIFNGDQLEAIFNESGQKVWLVKP